jgi:hypothetical protein
MGDPPKQWVSILSQGLFLNDLGYPPVTLDASKFPKLVSEFSSHGQGTTGPRQEPWEAQLAKVLGPATVDGFCELDDR